MSVDNASVAGMNYTTFPAHVSLVEWREGKGEVEYDDRPPLRESVYDVLPYCPFFDQFLTKLKGVTLPQAKKVKIDLVASVYDTKRQAPFHYPVAAGDYYWDATDEAMGSSTSAALQNTTAKLNEVVSRLNALVNSLLNAQLVAQINTNVAAGVNAAITAYNNGVVAAANVLVSHINSQIVTPTNAAITDANTYTVGILNANLIPFINNTMIGSIGSGNTINGKLQGFTFEALGILVAAPGLAGSMAPIGFGFPATGNFCSALGDGFSGAAGINGVDGLPWTNVTNATTSNQQWIPVGGTTPVTVTPAEQAAIMSGIGVRSNDLAVKRNTKIGQINALTTVAAVIAYDVTTGW
jgi:hypothetical protein